LLLLSSCLDLPDIFLLIILQKVIWIGPVKFSNSNQHTNGAFKLAQMLDLLSQSNCDLTVVGNMACKVIMQESSSISDFNMLENASVVWEFLKGRKLPGVMALDRVCFINFFDHFCCCNIKLTRAIC
jgi:phosphoglycerate kinase